MKKLFCKLPFSRISIDDDGNIWPACCPDWVEFPLGNVFTHEWNDIWNGEAATKFRQSMYDGSLRHCNRQWCPNIADAEAGIRNHHVVPHTGNEKPWVPAPPDHINLNYDPTCNLKCPSCRHDFIHLREEKLEKVRDLHGYVEKQILPTVSSIALTGVGDPFMSRVFRNFLIDFDRSRYPNIRRIHFHTNGQLFDEKMYMRMKGTHGLDLSTDISIDAASPETYAKVRPPGDWNRLMNNLKFIGGLDNLVLFGISMVVQRNNFREMLAFIELGEKLVRSNRQTFVEFKRPRQYYHLSDAQYAEIDLEQLDASEKQEFIKILVEVEQKRLLNSRRGILPTINHNLQEFLPEGIELQSTAWDRIRSTLARMNPMHLAAHL
jgi:MoaA/NifB/PqqE/SkfB family radical SAM enzyme